MAVYYRALNHDKREFFGSGKAGEWAYRLAARLLELLNTRWRGDRVSFTSDTGDEFYDVEEAGWTELPEDDAGGYLADIMRPSV